MTVKYEKQEPCNRCIHEKVCCAKSTLNDITYTVVHPYFNIQVVCTEFYNKAIATLVERDIDRQIRGDEDDK